MTLVILPKALRPGQTAILNAANSMDQCQFGGQWGPVDLSRIGQDVTALTRLGGQYRFEVGKPIDIRIIGGDKQSYTVERIAFVRSEALTADQISALGFDPASYTAETTGPAWLFYIKAAD